MFVQFVCNQLFTSRYMQPEGPWQRPAVTDFSHSRPRPASTHATAESSHHSGAPRSPSPIQPGKKNNRNEERENKGKNKEKNILLIGKWDVILRKKPLILCIDQLVVPAKLQ